jgi:hypothetical protein
MSAKKSSIFFGVYGLMINPHSTGNVMNLLEKHPMIYSNDATLKGLVVKQQHLTLNDIDILWKNYSTDGLSCLLIFSPYCLDEKLRETIKLRYNDKIVLVNTIEKII